GPGPDPAFPSRWSLRQAPVMAGVTLALAAVLVLLALPAVLTSYAVTVFILIFFYAFLGQAWNVVGGYAGQLSVGHAAFVGVGGYTAAMLSSELHLTPWLGMLVGGALAAVLGAVIGYLGFRFGLRGFYFVLLTVAFAEVCRLLVPDRGRGDVLRLLSLLAPAEQHVRHPPLGRDHHPAHRGRRGDAPRADPRLVHPHAARRAVAALPGTRGVSRPPSRRLRGP